MIDRISDLTPAEMLADAMLSDAIEQALEVPRMLDVLPDGREVVVIGDVKGAAEFNHQQGDNPWAKGTCGLVSCENVLKQFGLHGTEKDIVSFARDVGFCSPNGSTTSYQQVAVLNHYGVPSHVAAPLTAEMLASEIENGHGVIVPVNAGELWNDPNAVGDGNVNHAINISGTGRDPATGALVGFYINDSGTGESGKFVGIDAFRKAWGLGGEYGAAVVTDSARSFATRPMV